MYVRSEVRYEPLPLPDRVAVSDDKALTQAEGFLAQMKRRHSVRDFADTAVPMAVISACIATAATAPSGANQQPWHFVAISDPAVKSQIRVAAEAEERAFYDGGGGDDWLRALEPIGTGADKPHLEVAPWLIVVFAQRYGVTHDGQRTKNYYVPESVGIATGFLIAALHHAGLVALTHTPNPMKFLNALCHRPDSEKPVMILVVGHPSANATVPAVAKIKKPLEAVMTLMVPRP